jgi:hypothetical protein
MTGYLIYDGQKNLHAFMFRLGLNKLFDKVLTKKTPTNFLEDL